MVLGHEKIGAGATGIVVLNDWVGDTSTWDGARAYLDGERFTWAFADVRGYGRSRALAGKFDAVEIAGDAIELANALGWKRFSIVGHSMSTLPAIHVAQHEPDRIDRAVLLTPPPPRGFGVDDATLAAMQAVSRGPDAARSVALRRMLGEHASEGWIRFKVDRWRAAADPEAVAAYVAMFARSGIPDPSAKIRCPVLAVTGEQDGEHLRREAVERALAPICDSLEMAALAECGHYPMQECPPRLVGIVERFLASAK